MKLIFSILLTALLSACSSPSFVSDAQPVPVTSQTPDYFELPARFAFVRVVYGSTQGAGTDETEIWTDLAHRAETLGSFSPLVTGQMRTGRGRSAGLIAIAREQRYNYLLLVEMAPSTGSADVVLYHVGSGGVMATARAVSPAGGRNGFWGGRIRNPALLERTTLAIARAAAPAVEDLLRGTVSRQR